MIKIYLAGYISGEKIEECIAWRKKIREHYDNWKGKEKYPIVWLDPLNGQILNSIDKEGLKSAIPSKALIMRDFNCIKKADIIIANLTTFGADRPLIGTFYELAWAWYLKKITIIITDEIYYKEHPFIKDTGIIMNSVDELLNSKIINYFYKGLHSAIY